MDLTTYNIMYDLTTVNLDLMSQLVCVSKYAQYV